MSKKEEYVEVKVKVPKRFMRLLEEQDFFDKPREAFLTDAIRQAVHVKLNELDFDEQDKLLTKYGLKGRLVVDMGRGSIPVTA